MKCFVCKNEGASKCKKDNKTLLKKLHQENEMLKLIKNFKVNKFLRTKVPEFSKLFDDLMTLKNRIYHERKCPCQDKFQSEKKFEETLMKIQKISMKNLKGTVFSKQLETIVNLNGKIKTQKDIFENKKEEMKNDNEKLQSEIEHAQIQIYELSQNQNLKIENELEQTRIVLFKLSNEIQDGKNKNKKIKNELKEARKLNRQIKKNKKFFQEKYDEAVSEIGYLNADLEKVWQYNDKVEKQNEKIKEQFLTSNKKNIQLENENTKLEIKFNKIKKKNKKNEKKNIQLEKEITKSKSKLNKIEKKNIQLENENTKLVSKFNKIEAKNTQNESKNIQLENENAKLVSKFNKIEKKNMELDNENTALISKFIKLAVPLEELKIMKNKISCEIENRYECPICCDRLKSHAINPCGHCFCETCIIRLSSCPMCRERKSNILKLDL